MGDDPEGVDFSDRETCVTSIKEVYFGTTLFPKLNFSDHFKKIEDPDKTLVLGLGALTQSVPNAPFLMEGTSEEEEEEVKECDEMVQNKISFEKSYNKYFLTDKKREMSPLFTSALKSTLAL